MRTFPTEEVPDRTKNVTNKRLRTDGSRLHPWRVFVREGTPKFPNPKVYARARIWTTP